MKTIKAPAGKSGLVIEPWSKGEIYAVAANWAQASDPVLIYGERGWVNDTHGRQVADFRHSPEAALASYLAEAIRLSGGDEDEANDEAANLAADAVFIAN